MTKFKEPTIEEVHVAAAKWIGDLPLWCELRCEYERAQVKLSIALAPTQEREQAPQYAAPPSTIVCLTLPLALREDGYLSPGKCPFDGTCFFPCDLCALVDQVHLMDERRQFVEEVLRTARPDLDWTTHFTVNADKNGSLVDVRDYAESLQETPSEGARYCGVNLYARGVSKDAPGAFLRVFVPLYESILQKYKSRHSTMPRLWVGSGVGHPESDAILFSETYSHLWLCGASLKEGAPYEKNERTLAWRQIREHLDKVQDYIRGRHQQYSAMVKLLADS